MISKICNSNRGTTCGLAIGGIILAYFLYRSYNYKSKKKDKKDASVDGTVTLYKDGRPGGSEGKPVGKVKALYVYAVKSMRPIAITEVETKSMGLIIAGQDIRDRTWMVVSERGTFLSQRAEPRLSLLQPSIPFEGDMLHIDGPGMPTLKVSKYLSKRTSKVLDVSVFGHHLEAVHCGAEAAEWISKYLGKPGFSLVYLSPDLPGRQLNTFDTPNHKLFRDQDKVAFPDLAPVMMTSENTVNDIKSKVPDKNITVMNFRPNILIEGCKAFDEDSWDDIYIGQAKLKGVAGCDRCLMTTVNHAEGTKYADREPYKTLETYRSEDGKAPILGLFSNVITEGVIKVGDTVYVTKKSKKTN